MFGGIFLHAKQQKHQQMLQAAKRLFTAHGFERTSMQKIADEANVGVATFVQGQYDGSITLHPEAQLTAHTMMNVFGIAMKKHAFTSFMPYEIFPTPKKEQLQQVKHMILHYLKG